MSPKLGPRRDCDTMADTEIKEGDQVAWNWGGGAPGGKAVEVATEGEVKVTSHRGNEIKKNAEPENPAVHIARSGNDVVKRASELDVQKEGPNHKEGESDEKKDEESKPEDKKDDDAEEKKDDKEEEKEEKETNGDAKAGDKRKADESAEEKKDEEDGGDAAKKPKTDESMENGEKAAPKKKGRPAKKDANGESAPKKETKKKEPKKAATADGQPRRSGRNRS